MLSKVCVFFVFMTIGGFAFAQSDSTKVDTSAYSPRDDFSIFGVPVVFFLPETSWGFGATGIFTFNAGKKKAWRKSQILLGGAYTLKNQLLLYTPYELYFKQNWKLNGEIGYYRYFFNYFGIGIDAQQEDLEFYDANFPRFYGTLSYRLKPQFLLGIQYHFDYFELSDNDSLLITNNPVGIVGGAISTIGLVATYDSRDDIFYPTKGAFIEFKSELSGGFLGSDYNYSVHQLDARYFQTIKGEHLLAANFFTGTSGGNLPFFNYYYFSSNKRGRGFNDRRFIDRNISMLQLEYRFPIIWRFRGALFSSIGTVGETYGASFANDPLWSYGLGLRLQLSKKQMSHLRFDVAHSFDGFQFYFTVNEAF